MAQLAALPGLYRPSWGSGYVLYVLPSGLFLSLKYLAHSYLRVGAGRWESAERSVHFTGVVREVWSTDLRLPDGPWFTLRHPRAMENTPFLRLDEVLHEQYDTTSERLVRRGGSKGELDAAYAYVGSRDVLEITTPGYPDEWRVREFEDAEKLAHVLLDAYEKAIPRGRPVWMKGASRGLIAGGPHPVLSASIVRPCPPRVCAAGVAPLAAGEPSTSGPGAPSASEARCESQRPPWSRHPPGPCP